MKKLSVEERLSKIEDLLSVELEDNPPVIDKKRLNELELIYTWLHDEKGLIYISEETGRYVAQTHDYYNIYYAEGKSIGQSIKNWKRKYR